MQRAVVVLPQPLSPTSDSVSPFLRKNVTSSTAFTTPTVFCNRPRRIGKYFLSPFTSRRTGALDVLGVMLVMRATRGRGSSSPFGRAQPRQGGAPLGRSVRA